MELFSQEHLKKQWILLLVIYRPMFDFFHKNVSMHSLGEIVRMEEFATLLVCLQELYLPCVLRAEYLIT